MFWLKSCPKCRGDLYLENDGYERCVVCLQCGYRIYASAYIDATAVVDAAIELLSQSAVHSEAR